MVALDRYYKGAVELLRKIVTIKSYSFEEEERSIYLYNYLKSKNIDCKRIKNNIVAYPTSFSDSKPTLMLNSHIDTVKESDTYTFDATNPPLSDEVVWGLGSNDAGGCVVSLIQTFLYFNDNPQLLNNLSYNLVLALSTEEERSGPNGMSYLTSHLEGIDCAIVGEPTSMKGAIAERGLLVIDATSKGKSGHAARNEGINAIYIAIEDIDKIRNFTFDKVSPLMGDVNMSVTQINAGYVHNVIPDSCSFVVDIRPTDCYTNPEIMDILSKELKSELKPRSLTNKSSATPIGHPLLNALKKSNIESFISPTTSDWMRLSIPAVKIGPGDSARSHRADEYIKISEIEMGIDGYIKLIENL